jgi:hypothetical protein
MPRTLIRIGYAILIAAILLVSPLADRLPVDLAGRLAELTQPGAHAVHFRIVPAQGDGLERVSMALFIIGLAVLGAGLVLKARLKRPRRP